MKRLPVIFAIVTLLTAFSFPRAVSQPRIADSVRAEFLHAWNGYKQFAWGHDALRPLTKKPRDWYGVSLYMTPVDAYDVMLLMGLTSEASAAKQLILDSLSFDKNIEVPELRNYDSASRRTSQRLRARRGQALSRSLPRTSANASFRYSIRGLACHIAMLIFKPEEYGIRINNPAEIGTSLLEFGTLTRLTDNPVYYQKAKAALVALYTSPISDRACRLVDQC